jgi:hypothetical protein
MKRFLLVAMTCLSMGLAAPASGEPNCSEWPACPDGATPIRIFIGGFANCGCPKPADCDTGSSYNCSVSSLDAGGTWSCECVAEPVDPPKKPEPWRLPPPEGFCSGMVCPDGSTPHPDSSHCLCPAG